MKPHAGVTAKTMAVWVTKLLAAAGVNTDNFKQHSSRSAAATFHIEERHLTVKQIVKLGDWSTLSGVFNTFYQRFVSSWAIPIIYVPTFQMFGRVLYLGAILCINLANKYLTIWMGRIIFPCKFTANMEYLLFNELFHANLGQGFGLGIGLIIVTCEVMEIIKDWNKTRFAFQY